MPENLETRGGFYSNLPPGLQNAGSDVEMLLLREYGAVFLARNGVTPPKKIVFQDQADVEEFQSKLKTSRETIDGVVLELQEGAMAALRKALAEASGQGLSISPRGSDSAKRTYNETTELWASRVDPALKHWVGKGKMTQAQADDLRSLSPYEQVPEVLKLETQGIYFAKDLSKSVIYSVAPPGTSQHLSMLAFDVKEHASTEVRDILGKNGWYQTVRSDLPHFTFLGLGDDDLSTLGLRRISDGERVFWIPDIQETSPLGEQTSPNKWS